MDFTLSDTAGLPDIVQEAVVRPLNAKLGMDCFTLAGTTGSDVTIAYAAACATPQMRTKPEGGPPAGRKFAPGAAKPAAMPAAKPMAAPMRNSA